MKRLFFCLSFIICHLSFSMAQSVAQDINTIKRDTTFIYAEATMRDLNEALLGAKSILEVKVGDWVRQQHPDKGIEECIAKAREHSFEVQTRRGDYYRAFVYVRKNDIVPTSVIVSVVEKTEVVASQADTLNSDEKQMVAITSFYDVEPYIKTLRDRNRLDSYGKYATMPADSACHLFIYDQQGKVKAVLRKTSTTQINLNTLKEDNVKNYKNCGAIWFQLK